MRKHIKNIMVMQLFNKFNEILRFSIIYSFINRILLKFLIKIFFITMFHLISCIHNARIKGLALISLLKSGIILIFMLFIHRNLLCLPEFNQILKEA